MKGSVVTPKTAGMDCGSPPTRKKMMRRVVCGRESQGMEGRHVCERKQREPGRVRASGRRFREREGGEGARRRRTGRPRARHTPGRAAAGSPESCHRAGPAVCPQRARWRLVATKKRWQARPILEPAALGAQQRAVRASFHCCRAVHLRDEALAVVFVGGGQVLLRQLHDRERLPPELPRGHAHRQARRGARIHRGALFATDGRDVRGRPAPDAFVAPRASGSGHHSRIRALVEAAAVPRHRPHGVEPSRALLAQALHGAANCRGRGGRGCEVRGELSLAAKVLAEGIGVF